VLNKLKASFTTRHIAFACTITLVISIIIIDSCKKNAIVKSYNAGNAILSVTLDSGQVDTSVITRNADSAIVVVMVQSTVNLSSITPVIKISAGATINPASGTKVDFKDNGNQFTYLVTSQAGIRQKWTVKIKIAPSPVIYIDTLVTGFFNRQTGWIASDGGYTIPVSGNRDLWVFGDSYANDYDPSTGTTPCLFNNRSTAMVQPFNDWQWQHTNTLVNSATGTLFRSNPANGYLNWPAAGVQIGDTVYVYCLNIKDTTGGLGFTSGGNDVFAKMRSSDLSVVGYHQLQNFNGISFGLGIVKNTADGYVYIYGNKQTFIASNVFVARFPISNPNASWTFWDGATWNTDITKIAPVANAPSTSVEVAQVKDKYLMFTSEFSLGCDGGTHIYAAVSNSLTGPFSASTAIYKITDTLKGHYPFFYLPIPHPEYINANDELLLTYSINGYGSCVPGCVNNRFNPTMYRPRGIRIPLRLIDPSL
jgi:hypothetical protein